ncbi:hypothetical protein FOH10_10010 [Nocardia otitidiscaviarum]|uniref:Uncharacterized protein n=1 Tax=Nocardia otitidiscaviarum TaxID=1823 RepID=A0A516NJD9_9NOCA|nr:hypothetical protein [Nocardia otitidiscaviarum]MCP9618896.1 hypothetical protein [Nocardia otitidiscaviarum]QDP79018.1 hypothetical protein FOH10_10010 [Nocardia otitidiscaviarum]
MVCSARSLARRWLVAAAAGVVVLGGVVAAGPAAADWPASQQNFRIASVGVSGACVSVVGEDVALRPCTTPVGADQTWTALDGTYSTRLGNPATRTCLLYETDNGVHFRTVDCRDTRLGNQEWRYVLVKGYSDRGVIHQRNFGRGPLTCWSAFTSGDGSTGTVGGIRLNSECDSIKGDALPRANMWTVTPVG